MAPKMKATSSVKPLVLKRDRVFEKRLQVLSAKMAAEDRAEEAGAKAEAQADPVAALRRQQARDFAFRGLRIRHALS